MLDELGHLRVIIRDFYYVIRLSDNRGFSGQLGYVAL